MTSPAVPQRPESAHKLYSTPAVAHCIPHGVAVRSSHRAHASKTAPFANDQDTAHDRAHAGRERDHSLPCLLRATGAATQNACLSTIRLMRLTMSRPVDQTGKQHWPHGLSCPLAGLPPMLITGRGNWFFIFSIFRIFKVKKLQYRFQSERNQPRFRAVKLYEARRYYRPYLRLFYRPTIGQTGASYIP